MMANLRRMMSFFLSAQNYDELMLQARAMRAQMGRNPSAAAPAGGAPR